jgi:hypothetical protein
MQRTAFGWTDSVCVPTQARPEEPLESSRTGGKSQKPSCVKFSTIGSERYDGILNLHARVCSGKLIGELNLFDK